VPMGMAGTSPAMTGEASVLYVNLFGGWYETPPLTGQRFSTAP